MNYNKLKRKSDLLDDNPLKTLPLRYNKRNRLCANLRDDIAFGIFGVDKLRLKSNILSICRLTTRKKIDGFPNKKISDPMKLVILELCQGLYNPEHVDNLSLPDQQYIEKLIKRSCVVGLERPRSLNDYTDDELKKLLEVNLGQMDSNNNSAKLKQQTKQVLQLLFKRDYLNAQQVNHISKLYKLN